MHTALGHLFILIFPFAGCSLAQPSSDNSVKSLVEGQVKLNREIVWDFKPCGDIYCNGKQLTLMRPLKEWIDILGPYNRFNHLWRDVYTWDKYGLTAVCGWKSDTVEQMDIVFYFKHFRDTNTVIFDDVIMEIKNEISSRPNPFFQGGVMLDSVVLGRGMTVQQFNAISKKNGRAFEFHQDNILGHLWQFYPKDCDAPFEWTVEVSEDLKDVNQVFVYGRSNTVWELDQEIKADNEQYEKELRK